MQNKGKHIALGGRVNTTGVLGYAMFLIFIFQCIAMTPVHLMAQFTGASEAEVLQLSTDSGDHEMPFNAAENEAEIPLPDIDELINTSFFKNNYTQHYADTDLAYMVQSSILLKIASIPTPPPDVNI